MNDFESRLRSERLRLGLSQVEFATAGGVQKHAQFQYEKGMRRPNSDYLSAIAAAGVDLHYLLTGEVAARVTGEDERRVLSGYRALDVRQRAAVVALIEALIDSAAPQVKERQPSQPEGNVDPLE
ncbi:helix-turn-helix domain-containing protein [Burkholderia sp. MSMB1459WGS]|uniref:helix-turn-helix domain-containing protein n=1 Tax=Burkholderia sp. MSMB1459WGS TaxID=1637970 RepID=UPI0015D066D6|nr:helix-turn-helix transcriptional regulator [Burkholderia sp. MSMB1459WGS]